MSSFVDEKRRKLTQENKRWRNCLHVRIDVESLSRIGFLRYSDHLHPLMWHFGPRLFLIFTSREGLSGHNILIYET